MRYLIDTDCPIAAADILPHAQTKLMRAAETLAWLDGDTSENWHAYRTALAKVKRLESLANNGGE